MRFGRYLTEVGMGRQQTYNEPRSEPIHWNDAADLVLDNHGDALDGTTIFRISGGLNTGASVNEDFIYTDPSKGVRTSANLPNYYTLIIDNDPAWKKFPKRSKSVICSTARYYDQYIVLPEDGSKIGICPGYDIWESFEKSGISMLDVWTYDFERVLGTKGLDKSWSQLRKAINTISKKKNMIVNNSTWLQEKLEGSSKFYKWLRDYFNTDEKDFLKYTRDLLNPTKNGFKLTKSGGTIPKEKEVWTDGKCLLISKRVYEDFITEVFM